MVFFFFFLQVCNLCFQAFLIQMVYDAVVTNNPQGLNGVITMLWTLILKDLFQNCHLKITKLVLLLLKCFPLTLVFPSFPFSSYLPLPICLFPIFLPSLCLCVSLPDLKDFQNNKHRYLLASENQRPGNFSTASMGSLTASPSSCSLSSQVGLTSVSSIQERIMSTPGGEEAIERLKVGITVD